MKKKLLISQNASLFAELERKSTETKTLEIKLAEKEKEYSSLEKELASLKEKYSALQSDMKELELLNEELKDSIASLREKEVLSSAAIPVIEMDTPLTKTEREFLEPTEKPQQPTENGVKLPVITMDTPLTERQKELLGLNEDKTADNITTVPETDKAEKAVNGDSIPYEELKSLGLKAIGEVTRAAAAAMAEAAEKEDAATLKSMIMGKNESFKFEVLSLLENKAPTKAEKEELLSLTEAAKKYLQNANMM